MEIRDLLERVQSGAVSVEEAQRLLRDLPYEDIGFAKLDHHRGLRSGFGEVIYCAGKTCEQVVEIYRRFREKGANVLGTRAGADHAAAVVAAFPDCVYDATSATITMTIAAQPPTGCIALCAAGTSDMPVAEEAALTAEFFGARVDRIYDVGVAGIHRLFAQLERIRRANCIIAVAGMEGALPGVIAGLVDVPVVAVPTSVGYGANFGGLSALLTMLNSCAEGIGVVNIDNGFGAGYLATQINRLADSGKRQF